MFPAIKPNCSQLRVSLDLVPPSNLSTFIILSCPSWQLPLFHHTIIHPFPTTMVHTPRTWWSGWLGLSCLFVLNQGSITPSGWVADGILEREELAYLHWARQRLAWVYLKFRPFSLHLTYECGRYMTDGPVRCSLALSLFLFSKTWLISILLVTFSNTLTLGF